MFSLGNSLFKVQFAIPFVNFNPREINSEPHTECRSFLLSKIQIEFRVPTTTTNYLDTLELNFVICLWRTFQFSILKFANNMDNVIFDMRKTISRFGFS